MTDFAYIAIDPGETSGWAGFDEKGVIQEFGQFTQDEQNKWLDANIKPTVKMVIVEEYRNYKGGTFKGQKNQTSKNIGAIEMICELRGVPYTRQPANIKTIGYKFAGLGEPPKNHAISHQYDAVAHGTYYLRVNGILVPTSLD
jgi:hypothetical protein